MTLRERAIVETYTGKCMLTGKDRDEVYKYMTELMGRPVYRHELSDKRLRKELQARSLNDFVGLCRPPQTNADRIRSMTDAEIARFISRAQADRAKPTAYGQIAKFPFGECEWLEWLQSPVEV